MVRRILFGRLALRESYWIGNMKGTELEENKMILMSFIIPAYGRPRFLERAIRSVLDLKGSECIEVIVVDDCSPEPIVVPFLREQDQLIRLPVNSGAAVARNKGIDAARSGIISLLDSDDFIKDIDIINVIAVLSEKPGLYYSDIESQAFSSCYPPEIKLHDYFINIFVENPHIVQTSSLFFNKSLNIRFDESLPKHQDWDLCWSYLLKHESIKKIPGKIFFDRSDQKSLSRKYNPRKSDPWFNKVLEESEQTDIELVRYHLFCLDPIEYNIFAFYRVSIYMILNKKLTLVKFLKYLVRRAVK